MKQYRLKLILFLIILTRLNIAAQEEQTYLKIDTCWINQLEKVYLHLPLKSIVAGDRLPFKAYILQAQNNHSSDLSSILYFDIINQNGMKLTSWKSDMLNSEAFGIAIIPDTISSGVYILRSYTKWMLNAGNDYIFQTPLFIYNLRSNKNSDISNIIFKPGELSSINSVYSESDVDVSAAIKNDVLGLKINNRSIYDTIRIYAIYQGQIIADENILSHSKLISLPIPLGTNGLYIQ